ncbi:MAG: S8 family peptidase [Acidimicrobiaceae bacterium]|nr:S8 family peptidase [Acidimicrobiaceae bacterium]
MRETLEQDRAELAETTTMSDPELVAVFDLAGSVEAFIRAVSHIEGLEFLSYLQEDAVAFDEDFFYEAKGEPTEKAVPQSLYMVLTNARAVDELVSLFERWQVDQSVKFARGLAPLKQVFKLLRSVRRWGPEDRVRDTGLLEQWKEDVEVTGTQGVKHVEIELWYRWDASIRSTAQDEVTSIVNDLGGGIVATAQRPEIAYHGILATIPLAYVQRVLTEGPSAIKLLTTERVMFLNPNVPMTFGAPEPAENVECRFDKTIPAGRPRIALLDGFPMANHSALKDRLVIDDPDDQSSKYELAQQVHGSGMASLIAHGDLSNPGNALRQRIYIRPIFEPHEIEPTDEVVPKDKLIVDVIHQAFRRIFEGDGDTRPAAPSVRIVCLALGDPARVFIRRLSPLARLLDWLAEKYNLVIVVSGGNVDVRPTINLPDSLEGRTRQLHLPIDAEAQDPVALAETLERQSDALKSLFGQGLHRRLLAPAEAVNVLTVGSVHADELDLDLPDTVLDVIPDNFPASYSPVGFGFRRSVKPEVLLPGGRQVFQTPPPGQNGRVELQPLPSPSVGPGLRVAAPSAAGNTDAVNFTNGTSNSTALATRALSQIFDVLEAPQQDKGLFPFPDPQYHPILAKTLLVHAAGWYEISDKLQKILELPKKQARQQLTQILGYGIVRSARAISAEKNRVVLLGAGSIVCDQRHTFRFPLPDSLSASTEWRRLTITLGWLSPVDVRSQKYRMARLWFSPPCDDLNVKRTEAYHHAVRNGTVQHEVLEGTDATTYVKGTELSIAVDCRSDAGKLRSSVRYGLAVSLEVGPQVRSDIYNQIRSRLRAQVRDRVPVR